METKDYDEWSKFAYIVMSIINSNSKKKIKKLTELIGEHPVKKREQEAKRKKVDLNDKENLRQIALNKGLETNF